MAGELERVRPLFVEKVSTSVINQLLDDISLDRIVGEMEKESIIEENNIRSDKARRLIDAVRKKGDTASWKLIKHIHRRDPELFSVVGLSLGQPTPPDPQMDQQGPVPPSSIEAFWREKQSDGNVYPGSKNAISNRVALLITNVTFTNERHNRNGAERDEEDMETLLKGLRYEVVKYRDLTGQQIEDAVVAFSKHRKLEDTDSVVMVIMSHGKLGAVAGINSGSEESKEDYFHLDNIYKLLSPEKCRALINKPKILIVQACRGGESGAVTLDDSQSVTHDDIGAGLRVVHKEKDFISLLCSTPGNVGYRHIRNGSFLVQHLVDVFKVSAERDHVEELFRKVMLRFEDLPISSGRQMPTKDRCTITKHFYFYPGLPLD